MTQKRNCWKKELQYSYCRLIPVYKPTAKAETLALRKLLWVFQSFRLYIFPKLQRQNAKVDLGIAKKDIFSLMVGKLSSSI